ncbi:MAG: hypothetical protein WCV58_00535 [Patescibacteria group bacterium]
MKNKIAKIPYRKLRYLLSCPFILGMAIPIIFLDITMEIYHRIAFPLYGISINKWSNYIRIDRQKLSYLNFWDKLWCTYCGYANGVAAYSVKIAGDTEKYWCGIKHKAGDNFIEPEHHKDFLEYGDRKAYEDFINQNKKV